MAKKPDFTQLMVQHGERIGLGIAAFLALLLLFTSLFWPGPGLFSGSPAEKADTLEKPAKWVEEQLRSPSNLPTEADKPPASSQDKLVKLSMVPVDGSGFRVHLRSVENTGDIGRRQPKVLNITEARADVARVQVRTFLFAPGSPPKVYVLKGDDSAPGGGMMGGMRPPGGMGGDELSKRLGMGGKGKGGMSGGMSGGMGMMGMPGMGMLSGAPVKGKRKTNTNLFELPAKVGNSDDSKKDRQVVAVPISELDKGKTPAMQVRPLRMAVIAAAFPYKAQVEEFRKRLGHRTVQEVLSEASVVGDKEKQAQYAFRFLGVVAERRELDVDGKPVTKWIPLDLNGEYKPYVVLTGRDFEPDDQALSAVSFPGLVMPRLRQFHTDSSAAAGGEEVPAPPGVGSKPPLGGGKDKKEKEKEKDGGTEDQYPPVEGQLKDLQKTLEKLKDKDPAEVAGASRFVIEDEFDIFSAARTKTGVVGKGGGDGMMPMSPGPGKEMRPPTGTEPGAELKQPELPDHCLVRLIDVTVQPGKTYEYRLKVRMANPNYDRRDVADPSYADEPVLDSADWSKVPLVVRVDAELTYYAVDQAQVEAQEKDGKKGKYTGPYANERIDRDRQVLLQAHRWLERVSNSSGNTLEIGEWAIAERFPVYRGEYVGRGERIELPYWRYAREDFLIATDSTTSRRDVGISVPFGYGRGGEQPEAILVDFENGPLRYNRVVSRTEERVDTKPITDARAGEVLMMNPDGKLILRETVLDAADTAREERLEKVKKRVEKVKERNKPASKDKKGFGEESPP